MRIRYKKWARPELEVCPFYIDNPEEWKGKWRTKFSNKQPLHIELGCGKGNFLANLAMQNPIINYLGIDLVDAMLGVAKRTIESTFQEKPIFNVILTRQDIERIFQIFDKTDSIERIYINFCNPWTKAKHKKKRLTHPKQLNLYKEFLKPEAQVYFKTDDNCLFTDSLRYFKESGFSIEKMTYDLHQEENFWNNIPTEHEKMFSEQGIPIKALIAKLVQK